MKTIERHQSNVRWAEMRLSKKKELLEGAWRWIREHHKLATLDSIQGKARTIAAYQSVFDPNNPDIRTYLEYAVHALTGLYRCAEKKEGTVEVDLGDGGPPVAFEATGINALTHDGTWQTGFCLAAILRDSELMDLLCQFTSKDLKQAPGVTSEPFCHPFVDALRGYWRGDPDTAVYLTEAMELTDPERLVMADPDYVLHLDVPMMEVLFRLLEHDQQAFNDALANALELHRAYWGSETARRTNKIRGILALELCSLAALAIEQDIEIQVASDYIPGWLVRGEAPTES